MGGNFFHEPFCARWIPRLRAESIRVRGRSLRDHAIFSTLTIRLVNSSSVNFNLIRRLILHSDHLILMSNKCLFSMEGGHF